jgi:hypothetical protein
MLLSEEIGMVTGEVVHAGDGWNVGEVLIGLGGGGEDVLKEELEIGRAGLLAERGGVLI